MELLVTTYGILCLILLVYSALVFLIAQILEDNSVMDIAYGPAFFLSTIATAYLTSTFELLPAISIGCIGAWSVRLGSRIFRKNLGKPEDARYAKWRQAWMQRGRSYFLLRSYIQVNLFQVFLISLIAFPAVLALVFPEYVNIEWVAIGFFVFVVGLAYETIADIQLDAFISRKKAGTETATLMTKGLFRFSRRPNYFGETLIWWGLAIMVLPLPFGYLGLISPLLITYIVTKVTGPMLEDAFLEKYPDEYSEYKRTTSYFIPLPPKSG